ncbi:MAG: hypothetical protein OEV85_00685 [Candidatus Thorarchaeota archaeon]|nr:hypothetical protein [Candidatus Thorarchaeota archaeon]
MSSINIPKVAEDAIRETPKWARPLGTDPRLELVSCDEPFTRYRTIVDLLCIPETDPSVRKQRELVLSDERVKSLINSLPKDWSSYLVKGHDKSDYPPSVLLLLFDFGVKPTDDQRIDDLLNQMKSLQDDNGRFLSLARFPKKQPELGSNLCDTHIITETLLLGCYQNSKEVRNALAFITDHLKVTNQGIAWKCEPNSVNNARGPGKRDDICPQVTLEALRLFSLLSEDMRPKNLVTAGKVILSCWERSKEERPYMFGHGTRFRKLRPPFFWYNIGEVLDTLSRYQVLSKEPAFQDMLSVVISNADKKGHFTPESTYREFKDWSFGQKKEWSPWTTFFICRILKRVYG